MKKITKIGLALVTAIYSLLFSTMVLAGTPTFSVAFSPTTIAPGSSSTMTYTIDNSANNVTADQLAFTNTLPAGMTILNPNSATTNCTNGTYTATAGSNSISFSDYRLGTGQSCTFSLKVTSSTAGAHVNTTGALTSSAGSSGTANATLTVDTTRPGFSMAFSPATIAPGAVSTLTYTLNNSQNGSNTILLTFTNNLPSGMVVSAFPNVSYTCGSISTLSVVAAAGSSSIVASLISVNAGSSCTVSVDVTAATAGTYTNTTGDLTQNGANSSGPASAQLNVAVPFMFMNFPATASPGQSVTLSYTMTNSDRNNDATGITFTNDLNATLSGLAATALPATGFCGAGSTISGSSNISVANASLTSGSSCTFSITVLIPSNAAAGTYTNTSSTINLTQGSPTTKAAVSNSLVVKKAPLLTALFIDDPVSAGSDVTLRYTITNTDTANAVSAITFTENVNYSLNAFTVKTLPAANSCGTGSTVTNSTADSSLYYIQLSNGNIVAGGSCTFDVILTVGADAQPGSYAYSTSALTATVSGSTVNGTAASDTLVVVAAPSLSVAITESSAIPGSTVTAQFTLNYNANASADVTAVGFTLDLSSALSGLASTTATQNDVCGSGSSFSGTSTLTLSGASISPGGSCTFSVTLQIPSGATPSTITAVSSTVTGTTSGKSVSSAAASDTLIISGLSFSSVFVSNPIVPGQTTIIRYTISNAATALAATDMAFTHNLANVNSNLSATSLPSVPCGAGSTINSPSIVRNRNNNFQSMPTITNLNFSGGNLQPGESCTFDVPTLLSVNATAGNNASTTTSLSATVNNSNTTTAAATNTLVVETLTVNLSTTATSPTSTSPIPVKIDFNRAVTNFLVSDLTVGNGTASNLSGSGLSYTVDITPTTSGTVTVDLPANAVDDVGLSSHKNPAATQLAITYAATPATPTPTLVIAASSATKTNSGPITYGVTYTNAETVNLTTAGVTLNKTGTANATVSITGGSTATPTISLGSITGDGTLGVSIAAATARNGTETAAAVGPSNTFIVDNTKPTISITDTVATSVNAPFTATFTFSEAVSNFAVGDITVTNASLSAFLAVSTSVYTALVTPTSQGAVTLNVAAGVADDQVNNTNTIATQHSVTYDTVAPTVAITGPTTPVNAAFTATFTFSEDVTGFVIGDIVATNASLSNFAATSAKVYTATVTPTSNGAVNLNVAANVAIDSATNNNTIANQYTVTYDNVQPTVVISSPSAITNAAFTATITFSEDVSGFTNTDITANNAQLKTFSATSAKVYTIIVTPTNDGPVTLDVAANVAVDSAGNNNTAASQLNVTYDATKPTVVISSPGTSVNAAFTATFTFSEDVTGFVVGDIDPSNATLSNFAVISAKVYTATVTPTAEGSVTLDVAVDKAVDAANNGNTIASQYTVIYDTTAPGLVISAASGPFNAAFTATFTFSEDVTGFVVGDIVTANASLSNFVATSASIYTATVTPTSDGNVALDVAKDVALDAAGNKNTAATQLARVYDITKPNIDISLPSGPINTAFTSTFTFAEDVTGFTSGDITVGNGALSNFATTSAKIYTATITPTTDGPVTVDVAAGVAVDLAGNTSNAATQKTITYDATKPTLTITGPTTPVNTAFTATATFSEIISAFELADIVVTNGVLSNLVSIRGDLYTFTVTPTSDGSVTLNVAADKVIDTANNGNNAANQYSVVYDATKPSVTISTTAAKFNEPFTASIVFSEDVSGFVISDITANNGTLSSFSSTNAKQYSVMVTPATEGNVTLDIAQDSAVDSANNGNNAAAQLTVIYDVTKPTVVISTPSGPLNAPFIANFTFSEDVNNFVIGDITVSNATLSNFITTSAKVYTATVTPTTNGPVTIDVAAGVAQDMATNTNLAAPQVSVTYDNISPTLTIVGPTAPVKAAFTATFTFSEDVSGFTLSDITATNASVTDFVTTSAKVYTAKITPLTDGTVTVNVATGAASDSAANTSLAATQYSVVYDITAPTVTISAPTAAVNTAFVATFTFSEDVSGFTVTDITTGNASLSNFTSTSSKVYSATVTPIAQNNVTLNVAAGVAFDIANNGNAVASQYTVLFDSVQPDLVISAAAGPLNADFTATFTFTEDVSGFTLTDITTSNASLSNFVSTSAKVYTAKVSPSSDGQVTLDVAANVAVDIANNGNSVATQYAVQFDKTVPTLAITGPVGPVNAAFTATFTFSEDVSGFTIADIVATNADLSAFVTSSAKVYSVQVAPKNNGTVTVNVAANAAQDTAGNQNIAAAQYTLEFDKQLPGVVITGPTTPVNAAFTATFTFSKAVTNFSQDKIVTTNAVLSDFNAQSAPVYTAKVTPSTDGSVTLVVNAGTVSDPAGNTNGESNTLSVTYDATKPTIQTLSPANAAVDITTSPTLVMTFTEPVTAGTTDNLIIIKDLATNSVMESIAANTNAVSINGNVASVTLTKTYSEYTYYYVTIGAGALVDVANNNYNGISTNTQWQFRIINLPPVTTGDRLVVNEDSSIKSRVLSNDDGKNSQLNAASLLVKVQPNHGKTSVNNANGVITYTPQTDFNGSDSFTYIVSDMIGTYSAETSVTVTVKPVNDSPTAIDDVVTTALNNQLTINALLNDSDPDGSLNSEGLTINKQPLHGTAEAKNGQLFYTPTSNYVGSDSLQYTVVDNGGLSSNMATVYINVSGTNAAPIANADSANTAEDTAVTINVLSNDSDSDGQLVSSSLTLVSQPANGSASVQNDGSVLYTPNANYNGSDSFTYIVKDNSGANSAAGTVSVTISSVNDAPEALNDTLILVDRVNNHWINVLGNDLDVDGTITAINIITQPTGGSIQFDSANLLLGYTASTGFSGNDSFGYQITDNNGAVSAIATVTVGEGAVNDPPLANDDTVQTQEDQFIEINVLANDEDIDGILLEQTLVITSNPLHGSAIIRQSDGVIFYSPTANYSGFDTFTYQVSDNNGASATAKVKIQINSVNDAPVAVSHNISTNEDSAVDITLTATDGDNDSISYHLLRRPSKGTISGTLPSLKYQPNSDFNGNDSFTYYVNDGTTDSAVASVTITVNPVNDQPTANSLQIQVVEDISQTIILSGSDIDNDTLTYLIKNAPANGVLSGNSANRVYTPNTNFAGNDSFSYVVNDGTIDSATATVSITVSAINDAPIAANQATTTAEDTTLNITVSATDVDSQNLSYVVVTSPTNGSLVGTLPNVQYVPQTNFNGNDSFTFRANDGSLNSNLAKVSITVTPVNDIPVATAKRFTTREDQALFLTLTALDADNNTLTYQVTTAPTKGQLTGTAPNLIYTPNANFNGSDTFSFRANDGTANSAPADISITVTPVNDLPVAVNDSGTLISGQSLALNVLANDSDVDGDPLKIIGATAAVGSVTFTDTVLTYKSLSGFKGNTVVNYTISDSQGGTTSAKVLLQVNPATGSQLIAINVPADIEINAQGLFTKVDLGVATASDSQGNPLAVSLVNQNNRFRPGINTVYWQASDGQGNTVTASQQIKVNPIVTFNSDQIVREGNNAKVIVHLNGQAPQYPVIVPYTVSGTAVGALDHDLMDGEVTIATGTEGVITVNLFDDAEIEGDESLIITLDSSLNLGEKQQHTLILSEQPQAPSVNFKVTQAQRQSVVVNQDQGEVDIFAEVSQADSSSLFNYQWTSSDSALADMLSDNQHILLDPTKLAVGIYTIDLKVQDQNNDLLQTQQQLTIKIQAKAATLGSGDSDNDGISDIVEGLADDDNDGIANYLDAIEVACNVMPVSLLSNDNYLIESQPGVCLKLGATALARGENSPHSLDVASIGGVFDLLIDQLPIAAQSHQLVLPLSQPLPAGAHYRRQLLAGQWIDFIEDARNQIRSAAGVSGYCPSPDSHQWQPGLNQGHWCIQLSIEDGGANDNDNQANHSITFRGGVFSAANNRQPQVNDDQAQTRSNETITLDVLANDSDIDGDSLVVTSASATFGEVEIISNKLQYQPLQGLLGQDTVIYGISDGKGGSGSASVIINLVANHLPQVVDDEAFINNDEVLIIDVLANDSDADNDNLQLLSASSENGSVSITSDNRLSYRANNGFVGQDKVEYQLTDGYGGQAIGHLSVTVSAAPPAPTTIPPGTPTTPAPQADNNPTGSGGGAMLWLWMLCLAISLSRRGR